MKTLVISMLIILISLFSLIPASAQSAEEILSEEQQMEIPKQTEAAEKNAVAEPNAEITAEPNADMNSANDSNAIRTKAESFEGLDEELRQLELESREEMREWTRRNDERLELLLAAQQQTTAELNFLRKLAVEEGAEKTTAAIDVILLDRQERYKSVIDRLEKEKERLHREQEREERSRERGTRERTRERPIRSR